MRDESFLVMMKVSARSMVVRTRDLGLDKFRLADQPERCYIIV